MDILSFDDLLQAARAQPEPQRLLFAATLSGSVNRAPTTEDAEAPLQRMVESIKQGRIGAFIPFDPQDQPVQFG